MRRNLVPWLAGCQASPWLHNPLPTVPETLSHPNQSDLPLLMGVRLSTPLESASASPPGSYPQALVPRIYSTLGVLAMSAEA